MLQDDQQMTLYATLSGFLTSSSSYHTPLLVILMSTSFAVRLRFCSLPFQKRRPDQKKKTSVSNAQMKNCSYIT